jgi:transposase
MPPPLTPTQEMLIVTLLAQKQLQTNIAKAAGCSIKSVNRIAKNLKHFGTPKAPALLKRGRPPTVTEAMRQVFDFLYLFTTLPSRYRKLTCTGIKGIYPRKSLGIPGRNGAIHIR